MAFGMLFAGLGVIGEVFASVKYLTTIFSLGFVRIGGYVAYMDSLEVGNYLQALERLALSAWAFYEMCNESGWNLKEDKNSAQFVGYDSNATKGTIDSNLDDLDANKINHILNGSKVSNHHWERLSPNKVWEEIKSVIETVLINGVEEPYGNVYSKEYSINGYVVKVNYQKVEGGKIKIGDAWVVV